MASNKLNVSNSLLNTFYLRKRLVLEAVLVSVGLGLGALSLLPCLFILLLLADLLSPDPDVKDPTKEPLVVLDALSLDILKSEQELLLLCFLRAGACTI